MQLPMASRLTKRMYCLVTRGAVPYWLERDSVWMLLWRIIRKVINVVIAPVMPVNAVRVLLYRMVGYRIGKRVFIGMRCYLDDSVPERTVIEDDVVVAYGVIFVTHGIGCRAPIVLREGCIIGAGAILLGHSTVGRGALVGAGSVVTRDVPDKTVVAGNPAKPVAVIPGASAWEGMARIKADRKHEGVATDAVLTEAECSGESG